MVRLEPWLDPANDLAVHYDVQTLPTTIYYGSDGYFFLYDFDGVNLMHPRQPEYVGRNLLKLRDRKSVV